MMKGIIAEIGNAHEGHVSRAKELICMAHEAEAHYIKFQAIDPEIASKSGSMPYEFYKQVALTEAEYNSLIDYGEKIGAKVFASNFTNNIILNTKYKKLSAWHFQNMSYEELLKFNHKNTVVSIALFKEFEAKKDAINKMNVMIAHPYSHEKLLDKFYFKLKRELGYPPGYSDHSPTGKNICTLIELGCPLIEKHVTLNFDINFNGHVYRDCRHSIGFGELKDVVDYFNLFNKRRINL